jgi:hypothetical protein
MHRAHTDLTFSIAPMRPKVPGKGFLSLKKELAFL